MQQELRSLYQHVQMDVYRHLNITTIFNKLNKSKFLKELLDLISSLLQQQFQEILNELTKINIIKNQQELTQQFKQNSLIFKHNLQTVAFHSIQNTYDRLIHSALQDLHSHFRYSHSNTPNSKLKSRQTADPQRQPSKTQTSPRASKKGLKEEWRGTKKQRSPSLLKSR